MANDNYTIKVNLDFDKSKLKELENDVKKAVKKGSSEGFSSDGSVGETIKKKISEMQSSASDSVYKYGTNHLKTNSVISDLKKAQKGLLQLDMLNSRKSSSEKINDSRVRQQAMRESSQSSRLDRQKTSYQKQKFSELFRNVKQISSSSLTTAGGITSLISKIGPVGMAVGAGLGAIFGAGKAVKWAANKSIQYSSGALGSGYTPGEMAALSSGQVKNINSDIGKNIAASIQGNKLMLNPSNIFRSGHLSKRAILATAQFGATGSVKNLIGVGSGVNERQIYSRLFSDIRSLMSSGNNAGALSLGRSFGLSDEAVLALKSFNSNVNGDITKAGKGKFSSFDNLSTSALNQSSAIDNLTGKINLLAATIINFVNQVSQHPAKTIAEDMIIPLDFYREGKHLYHEYVAPGNSPKGSR